MMQWLLVFLGGGLGTLLRFGTSTIVSKWWNPIFPLATLIVNLLACIILGLTIAALRGKIQHNELLYAFMVIGICGGFSTFSAFAKENLDLFEKGYWLIALINIVLSVGLCIGAIYLAKK